MCVMGFAHSRSIKLDRVTEDDDHVLPTCEPPHRSRGPAEEPPPLHYLQPQGREQQQEQEGQQPRSSATHRAEG